MKRRRDSNGAAWRKARARVLAAETVCALCGRLVDKTLPTLHPLAPQVDHIIPVSKGGHPTARSNLQLAHRSCNRRKGNNPTTPPMPTSRPW